MVLAMYTKFYPIFSCQVVLHIKEEVHQEYERVPLVPEASSWESWTLALLYYVRGLSPFH